MAMAHSAPVEEVRLPLRIDVFHPAKNLPTGVGNIADIGTAASHRKDTDFIPETAVRASQDVQGYHTGRGGVGNEHRVEEQPDAKPRPVAPVGLADKLKTKLFGAFKH